MYTCFSGCPHSQQITYLPVTATNFNDASAPLSSSAQRPLRLNFRPRRQHRPGLLRPVADPGLPARRFLYTAYRRPLQAKWLTADASESWAAYGVCLFRYRDAWEGQPKCHGTYQRGVWPSLIVTLILVVVSVLVVSNSRRYIS
jgi:hypothetical protein